METGANQTQARQLQAGQHRMACWRWPVLLSAMALIGLIGAAIGELAAQETDRYPRLGPFKVMQGDDPQWLRPDYPDQDWPRLSREEIDPQGKLLWVRTSFDLPHAPARYEKPIGLFLYGAMSAEVWLNGAPIGSNGVPGATPALESPGKMHAVIWIPRDRLRSDGNQIAIRMSSYHMRKPLAEPVHCICLGEYGDPQVGFLNWYWLALLTGSALLLGAIYFAWLFVGDRRQRANLALACMTLGLVAQMVAETSRGFIDYRYPYHLLRLDLIYIFAVVSGLSLLWYLLERFSQAVGQRIKHYLLPVALALMLALYAFVVGYDGKTVHSLLLALGVGLWITGRAAKQGASGARTIGIALLGFMLVILFDPFNFLDAAYFLGAAALLILLFVQQAMRLRALQQEKAQAQVRSARLELELLKRQMQPHFLLNTLTALSELIESAPSKGVAMIEALAQEFRALIAISDRALIRLDQEVALCRSHLQVMQLREDRQYTLTIEGTTSGWQIPPGILHTLLENALSHNCYDTHTQFNLALNEQSDGSRCLRLLSPIRQQAGAAMATGLGYAYIKARMEEAYGQAWQRQSGPLGDDCWCDEIRFNPEKNQGDKGA